MDTMWMGPCAWAASAVAASEDVADLRRGPWTVDEDVLLAGYIAAHGEGRWNELARAAGLRRTGKSCRLRWLNYLRPDVRRGDFTPQEQLLILELNFRWGNRWSKIAQQLPGRTDNEIKNYWRTRVQKHAKQLKCDVNSKHFQDVMRHIWMPRLVERIHATAAATTGATTSAPSLEHAVPTLPMYQSAVPNKSLVRRSDMCHSPETSTMMTTSSTAGSSVSLGAQFPSNQLVIVSGSASARSDDMFDGSWSELLARACDDGADSVVLPDMELGESGDSWWRLEDIWLQQQY